jgi:von Willebrand factor type A domain
MAERKKEDGFNVAFLDVMSCGLGAVLMILIVLKFTANSSTPPDEIQRLQDELAAIETQRQKTQQSIGNIENSMAMASSTIEETQQRIEQLKVDQDATRQALKNKVAVVANLEKSVAAAAPNKSKDPIKLQGRGEENYLLGLKVEGKHIGILIDKSASMTEESLVKAIKLKLDSDAARKAGAKWRRTVRITKWLLTRLPKDAKVSVVVFNDKAESLGTRSVYTANVSDSMKTLAQEVDKLVPSNGTNLQAGLKAINKTMPNMTDLYVVTDGLPTLGEGAKGLANFAKCGSFFGKSNTISGECRLNLFSHTLKTAAPMKVRTNIILLPLEGDPQAPQAFWYWAAATGGMMISPASSWP